MCSSFSLAFQAVGIAFVWAKEKFAMLAHYQFSLHFQADATIVTDFDFVAFTVIGKVNKAGKGGSG